MDILLSGCGGFACGLWQYLPWPAINLLAPILGPAWILASWWWLGTHKAILKSEGK